jgi:hypothetical protein
MTMMTQPEKMPAARKDSEAFAFACRWLQRIWDIDSPWSSESMLTSAAGIGHWRDTLRRAIRFSLTNRLQVLAIARGGDADAIDVANELINELKSKRVPLPTELEGFSMDVHAGLVVARAPSGPLRKHRFVRNMMIALTVAAIMDKYGLAHSRRRKSRSGTGRPSKWRSASAITADALRKVSNGKIDLGEAAVERIYEKMASAMPGAGSGWTKVLEETGGEL